MKNRNAIIMFVLVIAVVGIAIYLAIQISNSSLNNEINTENKNNYLELDNMIITNEVRTNNEIIENGIEPENNIVIPEQNTVENSTSKDTGDTDKKQKAINLVKQDWGTDNSVYFYVDEEKNDGTYLVSVRDKNTTNVVVWYDVDVNKNTAKMQ